MLYICLRNKKDMKNQIENILTNTLPKGAFFKVIESKQVLSNNSTLRVLIAANDNVNNGCFNSYPQLVSLNLELDTLELYPQVFGGVGGRCISLKPEKSYMYSESLVIPFRTPKPNEKAVLNAITKFAENYVKKMNENYSSLLHNDKIDYSHFSGK